MIGIDTNILCACGSTMTRPEQTHRRIAGTTRSTPGSLLIRGGTEHAWRSLAQLIKALENGKADAKIVKALHEAAPSAKVPVLGITGAGGAGKSS